MSTAETHTQRRYWRWAGGALLLVLFVLLITGVGGWLARKSIAASFLKSYCAERGLVCTAEFERLGFGGAELQGLEIKKDGETPLAAERVQVDLNWPGFGAPALIGAVVDVPTLRIAHDGQALNLNGLDALVPQGGGGEGAAPPIAINQGRIIVITPAGDVSASVNISGTLPQSGKANVSFDPVRLETSDGVVDLRSGVVDLDIKDKRLTGQIDFNLAAARYGDMALDGISLRANARGDEGADGPISLTWQADIAAADTPALSTVQTRARGEAQLSGLPDATFDAVFDVLNVLVAEVETGPFAANGISAEALSVQMDLAQSEIGVEGPVALKANGFVSGPLAAESVRATGTVSRNKAGDIEFTGDTSMTRARLATVLLKPAIDALQVPQPFADHGRALSTALVKGSERFDLALDIEAGLEADGITLSSGRATSIKAASGLILSINPVGQTEWLVYDKGALALSGQIAVSGGGAPAVTANLDGFETEETDFTLQARSVDLKPWSASGKTLSADLSRINMSRSGGVTRLAGQGAIRVSGPLPGVKLQPTTLSGGIDAATDKNGWRMQTLGGDCLGFASQGMDFGAIKIDPVTTDLCPEDGRFIRQSAGTPEGRIVLGDVTLPFTTSSGGGTLSLTDAGVDWSADSGLAMTVTSNRFSLPLNIGERTLTIDGVSPSMGVVAGSGPLKIRARLAETDFGGSMVPAKVSAGSFEFDGRSGEGGINGNLKANGVEIADLDRADPAVAGRLKTPIYQPLIADFTATLNDRRLNMTGPVRLKRGGITLADTRLDIDIVTLDGTAGLVLRDLNFKPGGLQPVMLSELLRGSFTNAVGNAIGVADFQIDSGTLAGTGKFSVEDFGFQTTSLGLVEGVTGTVEFSDLIGLTTPPGQAVKIAAINPGVPLTDGEIVFQLLGGKEARLQAASFPFAGGRLFASPTVWVLGGQEQTVNLQVSNIELERMIDVLKLPDIKATGTLSGAFPIFIETSNVFIRDAKLTVDDEGGTLAYTGKAADAAAQNNQWVEMAFEALRDLDYTVLEIGLDGNVTGDMNVTLNVLGRNPDVFDGSVFRFNIAVDSPLYSLIQSRQYYSSDQSWLADVVAEQVISDREEEAPSN